MAWDGLPVESALLRQVGDADGAPLETVVGWLTQACTQKAERIDQLEREVTAQRRANKITPQAYARALGQIRQLRRGLPRAEDLRKIAATLGDLPLAQIQNLRQGR